MKIGYEESKIPENFPLILIKFHNFHSTLRTSGLELMELQIFKSSNKRIHLNSKENFIGTVLQKMIAE